MLCNSMEGPGSQGTLHFYVETRLKALRELSNAIIIIIIVIALSLPNHTVYRKLGCRRYADAVAGTTL